MKRDLDSGFRKPGAQVHRKSARVRLAADVKLKRSDELHFEVQAFDLSREGCKVEFREPPRLDEQVWVTFEGLEPLGATVCWIEGRVAGLEFARPIHAAVFDHLVGQLR